MTKATLRKIGSFLLWTMMFAAAGFVLFQWFYPVYHYFYDDEWFVLPERVWFKSGAEWLSHLLFFNQTRFTFSGDQILVRPGLFLWMWLQDEVFRSHREWQQVFLGGVALSTFAIFYGALRRECGRMLAFAAAVFAFTCLSGLEFYSWSHLSGYVLALAFYTLAVQMQFGGDLTSRRAVAAGVLFFLAETCHEMIAVSLVVLVIIEMFRARPIFRHENCRRLLPLVGALFGYSLIVLVVWSLYPPRMISGTATQAVPFNLNNLLSILKIMWSVFLQALNNLVPFPSENSQVNVLRWILGGLMIASLTAHQSLRGRLSSKLKAALIPLVILFLGLAFGRVSMQASVKIHYFPIFQFFAVFAVMLMWPSSKWGRRLAPFFALVLLASSVRNAFLVGDARAARESWVGPALVTAGAIEDFLKKHPERCFAGIYDPLFRTQINAGMNISFQIESCGWREGTPTIFKVSDDGQVSEYRPTNSVASVPVTSRLSLPASVSDLDSYLVQAPLNFLEERRGDVSRGVELRALFEPVTTHCIQAKFSATEGFPLLYNSGLAVAGERGPVFFLLMNNMLRVLTFGPENKVVELTRAQVPQMKSEFSISIVDNGDACEILYDEFMVTQIPSCLRGGLKIGTFTFNNGSAPETLVDLAVAPY